MLNAQAAGCQAKPPALRSVARLGDILPNWASFRNLCRPKNRLRRLLWPHFRS